MLKSQTPDKGRAAKSPKWREVVRVVLVSSLEPLVVIIAEIRSLLLALFASLVPEQCHWCEGAEGCR